MNAVVDVDGSFLYKKYKRLKDAGGEVAPLGPPPPPPTGWIAITQENHATLASGIPPVTADTYNANERDIL